ncbi:GAF domain-containing hybrid sensor histidine kinase/response regulator [Limnoglobus roseus]|uniref:histidine kinase n=1 Tax=Limnoglobus roseus TaxID=2598579 RepID=A0A5C1AAT0_9BACT|nr:ATP-binding protein [Limnoglobus roseus]QEL15830.1 sensory box histidine kinase/response regulator [Limnoglobus roseus]
MSFTHPEPRRPSEAARLTLTKLPAEMRLAEVFARACEIVADAARVARVGVWLYIDQRSAMRCANLYERSTREHSAGAIIRVADFPAYFSSLTIRKAVPAEVAATDPRTAELAAAYLMPLGISSILDAGIFIDGELAGVVCHEHVGPPREWTTEDRDFAGSVADILGLRIQSAEVADLRAALRTQAPRLAMVEKAEALEQMAAGLSHDFRNLLSVVVGGGDLLAARNDLAPEAREMLNGMVAAAGRGVDLANEMMDFARPSNHPPAVIDLSAATGQFLPVLRAATGDRHSLRYARPAAVGTVLIDRSQYTRLLLNLVVNARDALPGGGEIRMRIAPVRIDPGTGVPGHYVMVEVADGGVGMDDSTRRRAFDSFFTTKSKGTGVGLAVVRRAVDRAGGFVRIESAVGKGTTVRAFFPRVGASSGETTEYAALPPE